MLEIRECELIKTLLLADLFRLEVYLFLTACEQLRRNKFPDSHLVLFIEDRGAVGKAVNKQKHKSRFRCWNV